MAFNNNEIDGSEPFCGRSVSCVIGVNRQIVKAVWKEEQLEKYIFPSFERVFRALGFDKVDWWDLLGKVAFSHCSIKFSTKKDNLAYLRDPTDIGIVGTHIKCHPGAFRGTEVTFRALDLPDDAFYFVEIVGHEGGDTHRFHFEPSISWLCSRFPHNCS